MCVEGRIKDVINRGGEKVSPGEVEDHLAGHPEIREAAVIGVPDQLLGERVCVCVVPRGAAPGLTELQAFLRECGLAEYKLPQRVQVVDALPRTSAGKIDKTALVRSLSRPVAAAPAIDA